MVLVPRVRYEKLLADDKEYKANTSIDDKTLNERDGRTSDPDVSTKKTDSNESSDEKKEETTDDSGDLKKNDDQGDDSKPKNQTSSPTDIVMQFPQKYQLYAKRLLGYIKKNGGFILGWDNEGRIVYNGVVLDGTNIKTLVQHIFKSKGPPPKGIKKFRKALNEIRVPKVFLKPFFLKPPGVPDKIKKNWIKY